MAFLLRAPAHRRGGRVDQVDVALGCVLLAQGILDESTGLLGLLRIEFDDNPRA
jgi:hypothetical protein